jgi:hypothetical protein
MNLYDDVLFKSGYEKNSNKIPLRDNEKQIQPDFQTDFLEIFSDVKTEDIKSMMFFNESEKKKFDFLTNKQEFISPDFFLKSKNFDDQATNYQHLISFLIEFYGDVLTPKIFRSFINDFKASERKNETFSSIITFEECQKILYSNFNKYQINLKDDDDKKKFLKFLNNSLYPPEIKESKYSAQESQVSKKNLIPESYRSRMHSIPESSRRK